MQVGLVKKCWNKRTDIRHPNMQHTALLQPYLYWFNLKTFYACKISNSLLEPPTKKSTETKRVKHFSVKIIHMWGWNYKNDGNKEEMRNIKRLSYYENMVENKKTEDYPASGACTMQQMQQMQGSFRVLSFSTMFL